MQKVSKAYKESMKSSLRERAYIMISFGLVNQEAQAKATVDNGSYATTRTRTISSESILTIRSMPLSRRSSRK